MIIGKIKFWLDNARWVALPQSLLPGLAAVAASLTRPGFNAVPAVFAVIGACSAHLSFNLIDDYFDYKSGDVETREALATKGIRARAGKCGYIASGQATLPQLLAAALIFACIAGVCGAVAVYHRGIVALMIAASAAFLGISYSSSFLKLSYRGFGELIVGIVFGPLLVAGVYFSACGEFGYKASMIGNPLGLMIMNILYTHSLLDLDADRGGGKLTLAGFLPTGGIRIAMHMLLTFLPFAMVLIPVAAGLLSVWYLAVFLTLGLAVSLTRSMRSFASGQTAKRKNPSLTKNADAPPAAVPRPWYGPMERWDEIKDAGIDWFMLRWYMARNLMAGFSILLTIAALLEWATA